MNFCKQLLWISIVAVVLGCTGDVVPPGVEAPVQAGFASPDEELAGFLADMYATALADPESGAARGRLGIAYEINSLTVAARRSYGQAEALDPTEFLWPYYLALLLGDRGDLQVALDALDRAQALDPDYLPAWLWRGTFLLDLDRDEQAAAAFQQAIQLGGGPPAQVGLARTMLRQDRPEAAVGILEPLLIDFPHPFVHRLLGRCYQVLGRTDEAEIALVRGRKAEPLGWRDENKFAQWDYVRGFNGRLTYANLLLGYRRREDALRVLESLQQQDPDHEVLLQNLSSAYAQVGEMTRSFEVLRHALDVHPDSFSFHLNIAQHYDKRGDAALALEHLQRAVELSPDLSPAHEMMGEILLRRSEYEPAMMALEKAHSPKGYYYMGMIEGAREDWPKAIGYFEKSVTLDPADTRAFVYLGRSLAEAGRYQESRVMLRKAQQLGTHPDDVGNALQRLKNLEGSDGR